MHLPASCSHPLKPCGHHVSPQVVLDNFNSASPEVVERLLPLMEDEPSLHLYEHAEGEVLSYANGGIHGDFRLALTSVPARVGASKISSATLNRTVCLQIASPDAGRHACMTRQCAVSALPPFWHAVC